MEEIALSVEVEGATLPGILTLPKEHPNYPLVIFLHGSGPNDKNSTVGIHKPFETLAHELAKEGIASYRFDKKAFVNPQYYLGLSSYTVREEIHEDAQKIIHYLQSLKENNSFNFTEIILLGHSLSAGYLPQIIKENEEYISKGIMVAGTSRNLVELMEEQLIYLRKIEENAMMDDLLSQTQTLKTHLEKDDLAATDLQMNVPYSYWKENYHYHASQYIQSINTPLLLIQGGKDYQVNEKDYIIWQKMIIKQKFKHTKLVLLAQMNHIMNISTNEHSSPAEYMEEASFDKSIIKEISNFIFKK